MSEKPGLLLLLLLLGSALFAASVIYGWLLRPSPTDYPKLIEIPHGIDLKAVATKLQQEGLIRSSTAFIVLARLKGVSSSIRAGEYLFQLPPSPLDLLNRLTKGDVILHKVTVPEGSNIHQVAALLARLHIVEKDRFLAMARSPDTARRFGLEGPTLEGYLFPDTYLFPSRYGAERVITKMVSRFKEAFGRKQMERARQLGYSVREIVTLASIIEKEASDSRERPLISSVFHNRLKRGMRLESDPTAIYGLGDLNRKITRRDLARQTPYNTYIIQGLPPGPISNPGEDAIEAALYPADSPYLYFVSRNDGTHYFSSTLREHLLAVKRFRRR